MSGEWGPAHIDTTQRDIPPIRSVILQLHFTGTRTLH